MSKNITIDVNRDKRKTTINVNPIGIGDPFIFVEDPEDGMYTMEIPKMYNIKNVND